MYFLYILQSIKTGRYYIGSTNNPERRLTEHNSGKTKSLKFLRPLKMVFSKEFQSEADAKKMEIKLKKFKNRNIIEQIVKQQNIITGL